MERERLETAAAHFPYLRGLLFIPIGVWFIVTGSTLLWSPGRSWITLGTAALAAVAYLLISRYYKQNYGTVTPPKSRQWKDLGATLAGMVAIVAGAWLDSRLDLPISGYGAIFALVMLLYGASVLGVKVHHLVIWGGLLVASLLPLWPSEDIPVVLFPMGVATIVAGIFDHALLMRTYGSPQHLGLENSNAGI